uniref:Uncharacterized protein n=1 Tax=Fagus sylvatica TaxID=28930 RepID=A0A2N9GUD1_FAGSY
MSFENDWDTSYMEHVPPRACRYLEPWVSAWAWVHRVVVGFSGFCSLGFGARRGGWAWVDGVVVGRVWVFGGGAVGLGLGSLAIISNRVGLDRVLSCGGGGDIGFRSPAVSAELNLVKLEGNESWPIIVGVKSITGERLPGESRILKLEDKSGSGFGFGGGDGGGGGGGGFEFEAGQHQGLLLSGETMVGGPSFRVGYPGEYSVLVAVAEDEIVVSRYLRRLDKRVEVLTFDVGGDKIDTGEDEISTGKKKATPAYVLVMSIEATF